MGNVTGELISEEKIDQEKLLNKVESENFELSIENRNCLRKVFLKVLKKTLKTKNEVYDSLRKKEENSDDEMAKQVRFNNFNHIFNGSNYSIWKIRIMKFLEVNECKEQATRERLQADNEDTWKKNNIKAEHIIMSAMSDKLLECIKNCKSSYEILKQLDESYENKSRTLQIINGNKLEDVKLKNYNTPEEFFYGFRKGMQ